jgi:hypothetical protein
MIREDLVPRSHPYLYPSRVVNLGDVSLINDLGGGFISHKCVLISCSVMQIKADFNWRDLKSRVEDPSHYKLLNILVLFHLSSDEKTKKKAIFFLSFELLSPTISSPIDCNQSDSYISDDFYFIYFLNELFKA